MCSVITVFNILIFSDKSWVCDGTKQCIDGSDEAHCCESESLNNGRFQCVSNGVCIPVKEVCDGWKHCTDGSDEMFLACSLKNSVGHNVMATGEKPYKGTMFFTVVFFIIVFSFLLVIIYRCAKRYVLLNDSLFINFNHT